MSRFSHLAAAVLTGGIVTWLPTAIASTVSFSSLPGNNTSFGTATDYVANWTALVAANPVPPAGYGNAHITTWDYPVQGNVDNHELVAGGSSLDLAFHYQIDFIVDPGHAGNFDFRIAPDFGFGGAVFLNGIEAAFNPADMWWGADWNNVSQQFTFSSNLAPGNYTLDVYGQEGCCDGPTGAEFAIDGGAWTSFGDNDGLNVVPETSGMSVLIPGAAYLAMIRIRRWNNRTPTR